jgi:hypothetical protein
MASILNGCNSQNKAKSFAKGDMAKMSIIANKNIVLFTQFLFVLHMSRFYIPYSSHI